MKREDFERDCKLVEFVPVGDRLFFYKDMVLFNPVTGRDTRFASFDRLFAYKDGGYSVAEKVAGMDTVLVGIDGGNGSSSAGESTFKFNHAPNGGRGGDADKLRFPAEFNDGEKVQSFDKALDKFRDRHANSDHEYGITVDDMGYVHRYVEGGPTSVAISGRNGQMVIHNHPSDSAFSDTDLLSMAQVAGERGVVASGKSGDYIIRKTPKFDAAGFAKAVRGARMTGTDYNDAVDRWLTKNQGRYGYTYEFRKAR